MRMYTPRSVMKTLDTMLKQKDIQSQRQKTALRFKMDYLNQQHTFRMQLETDRFAKKTFEQGLIKYSKQSNFIGGEIVMTGNEAKQRNHDLEEKFVRQLKTNPDARLYRWVLIKEYKETK